MSTILHKIVAGKRRDVESRRKRAPPADLRRRFDTAPPLRDFRAAL
jgi:hypothetical protein